MKVFNLNFRNQPYRDYVYKPFVRSKLGYADVVWDGCFKGESDWIETVQFDAAKLITGAMKGAHRESLLI